MTGPKLPFKNDGSFLEMFAKLQQAQAAAGGDAGRASAAAEAQADSPPPPPPSRSAATAAEQLHATDADGSGQSPRGGSTQQQDAAPDGPSGSDGQGDAGDPPPPPAAPPGGRPASAPAGPAVLLRSKKPIVQVRSRSGDVLQSGSSKRRKGAADGAAKEEPKSFYLQEMERYRQGACESSAGSDRPLVK